MAQELQNVPEKPTPQKGRSQKFLLFGSILAIVASVCWIYHYERGTGGQNQALHQMVGQVLAEETARAVGRPAKIVVVTTDLPTAPELRIQMAAFEKRLKLFGGISIQDKVVLDPGENPKYRAGSGLSAKRFLKIARKHHGVDAIVSFVGAPELSDQELLEARSVPKFVAETHSPEKLMNLLGKKILISAVVPRFEFPAPGPRKPRTGREWFDRYFQVLTPDSHLAAAADDSP